MVGSLRVELKTNPLHSEALEMCPCAPLALQNLDTLASRPLYGGFETRVPYWGPYCEGCYYLGGLF